MAWRIMVVDDDPLMRSLINSYLAEHTAEIIEVDSAEWALKELLANPFDLLITDIQLPGSRSGLWLLNLARNHLADLPIIVITGTPPEESALQEADAVLIKPFHPDELLGVVLELLGK